MTKTTKKLEQRISRCTKVEAQTARGQHVDGPEGRRGQQDAASEPGAFVGQEWDERRKENMNESSEWVEWKPGNFIRRKDITQVTRDNQPGREWNWFIDLENGEIEEVTEAVAMEIVGRRSEKAIDPDGVLSRSVCSLNLSVRSGDSLCIQAQIKTIGQLFERNPRQLLRIKNFGRVSLSELFSVLVEESIPLPEDWVQYIAKTQRP